MVEQVEAFHHFPPHPLQTNQDSQGYHPYSASTLSPPENSTSHYSTLESRTNNHLAPMSGPGYEFSQHFDPSPSWENSPFLSHSPRGLAIERSLPEEASGAFWRQGGSSLPGAYHPSHFRVNESSISTSLSPQGSREAFGSQGGRDDRTWHHPPAPIRSMSLVTPEELPAHYQARYFHQPPFPARRVSATLGGSASSIYSHHTPDLATDSSTLGHHGHVEHAGGFSFPQWGTYPPQGAQTTESSTGYSSQQWYTASTNLDQVREEGSNPHTYQPAAGTSQYQRNPG